MNTRLIWRDHKFLLASVALLLLSVPFVAPYDQPIIDMVRQLHLDRSVALNFLTELGLGLTQVMIFLVLLGFYEEYQVALCGLLSLLVGGILTVTLKHAFLLAGPGAPRPSFPSGHTTTSFAMAVVLATRYPKWRPVFFLIALCIGLSRVLLVKHYPTDVLAGASLGLMVGTLATLFWDKCALTTRQRAFKTLAFALLALCLTYSLVGSDVPKYQMRLAAPLIIFILLRKAAKELMPVSDEGAEEGEDLKPS